jgi:hypothetical protein
MDNNIIDKKEQLIKQKEKIERQISALDSSIDILEQEIGKKFITELKKEIDLVKKFNKYDETLKVKLELEIPISISYFSIEKGDLDAQHDINVHSKYEDIYDMILESGATIDHKVLYKLSPKFKKYEDDRNKAIKNLLYAAKNTIKKMKLNKYMTDYCMNILYEATEDH